MKSILSELYYGNINPGDLICPKDTEYHEINKKISAEMKFWKSRLTEEEYDRLDDLQDLFMQSGLVELRDTFRYSFKLGALIMVETFTGSLNE